MTSSLVIAGTVRSGAGKSSAFDDAPRSGPRGPVIALGVAVLAHIGVLCLVLFTESHHIVLQSAGRPASSTGVEVTFVSQPSTRPAPPPEHPTPTPVASKPIATHHTPHVAHVLSSVRSHSSDIVHDDQQAKPVTQPAQQTPTPLAPTTSAAQAAAHTAPAPLDPTLNLPGPSAAKNVKSLACNFPQPVYASHAKRLGEEGVVMLHVSIDTTGHVASIEIAQSSGYADLDDSARQAMLDGSCQPYIDGGRPIPVNAMQPVSFRIDH